MRSAPADRRPGTERPPHQIQRAAPSRGLAAVRRLRAGGIPRTDERRLASTAPTAWGAFQSQRAAPRSNTFTDRQLAAHAPAAHGDRKWQPNLRRANHAKREAAGGSEATAARVSAGFYRNRKRARAGGLPPPKPDGTPP
jgi:hypothetical protein